MNHKIKEISFESITSLASFVEYRNSTYSIKLVKGRYKLPEWIAKIIRICKR